MATVEPKRRTLLCDDEMDGLSLREAVMESLLQLHLDFRELNCIADAGPLLHALMQLAYHAGAEGSPSVKHPPHHGSALN